MTAGNPSQPAGVTPGGSSPPAAPGGHSAAWHDERRKGIGGSDATLIMAGEWNALWKVKTGRAADADLSDVLPVQMGVATEALNLAWFARHTGLAVDTADCEAIIHPSLAFMRCNLDGRVLPDSMFEAKHVGDRYKLDEIASRYFWQLQHCMAVTGSAGCYLSVFFGNSRWEYATVARDDAQLAALINAEREFWNYVTSDTEPADRAKESVKVDVAALRVVDMSKSNSWCVAAAEWLETHKPAKRFEVAARDIKGLIEGDVGRAHGAGIECVRNRAGALSIKELPA